MGFYVSRVQSADLYTSTNIRPMSYLEFVTEQVYACCYRSDRHNADAFVNPSAQPAPSTQLKHEGLHVSLSKRDHKTELLAKTLLKIIYRALSN